ncbi:hypothetical protein ARAM_002452 [Aspergillus rambellii]|uniref:G-patch domain-containing protein n=1 Tax=Aspergillus rambellii TaxID=308745 RepID=A0A0F8V062_9EURO|nr:hypothetical protein ARAM_002452 [Aspergillus rambellii]
MAPYPRDPAPKNPTEGIKHDGDDDDDDDDDYMSMVIEEPQQKETFTQKKRRLQREAEARAKVPSKAERAAQEAARRDVALATSTLDPSNKGFRMMAKLGFKPGQSLGKPVTPPTPLACSSTAKESSITGASDDNRQQEGEVGSGNESGENGRPPRTEPLNLVFKEDRGGIGLESERKRRFKEEVEDAVKKVKQDEGDYRDRVRMERETRRTEAQIHGAQRVAERLDAEAEGRSDEPSTFREKKKTTNEEEEEEEENEPRKTKGKVKVRPTLQIPVLYRGLVREREEKERNLQTRHMLQTSLPSSFFPSPRLPGYDDATLEQEDREALGGGRDLSSILEQELEEDEDPELDEFNALEPTERLKQLVQYLREKHQYCFWCKYRYESAAMEGCPGETEEDHD